MSMEVGDDEHGLCTIGTHINLVVSNETLNWVRDFCVWVCSFLF